MPAAQTRARNVRAPRARAALAMVVLGHIWPSLPGCVVEEVRPISPFEAIARSGGAGSSAPGVTKTRTTRGAIAVLPLGRVKYDGLTLPLTSPRGEWLVTQEGPSPSWNEALALGSGTTPGERGASPLGRRLAVYRITDDSLTLDRTLDALPPGTLLGRSCDDEHFLVERVMDDGSRWIGRVPWLAGGRSVSDHVEWLVADEHANAHATLVPAGPGKPAALAWSRRRLGSARSELVFRPDAASRSGEQCTSIAPANAFASFLHTDWFFPLAVDLSSASRVANPWSGLHEQTAVIVWALSVSERSPAPGHTSLDLVELDLAPKPHPSAWPLELRRLPIASIQTATDGNSREAAAPLAHQAASAVQTPAVIDRCDGALIFSPGAGSMLFVPSGGVEVWGELGYGRSIECSPAAPDRASPKRLVPTLRPLLLDQTSICGVPVASSAESSCGLTGLPASALVVTPDGLVEVPFASAEIPRFEPAPADPSRPLAPTETSRQSTRIVESPTSLPPPVLVNGIPLLSGSFVPRATLRPDRSILLLSPPVEGEDSVLEVFRAVRVSPANPSPVSAAPTPVP